MGRRVLQQGAAGQHGRRHAEKQEEASGQPPAQSGARLQPARQQFGEMQQHGRGRQHSSGLEGPTRSPGTGPQQVDGNDDHQRRGQACQQLQRPFGGAQDADLPLESKRQDAEQGE
ncbi:hypothetical protein D3C75_829590 [compost metagenome]